MVDAGNGTHCSCGMSSGSYQGYYLNIIWGDCVARMEGMKGVSFQAVGRCS